MASIDTIVDLISKHDSFLISTHKHCDGDGLGAGIALHYILKELNKKTQFVTLDKPHYRYQFLDPKQEVIRVFQKDAPSFSAPEVLFIVDTNDYRLVEPLYSFVKQKKIQVCFIDHHPVIHNHAEDIIWIQKEASSTAEIIYSLLKKLKISLNEKTATSLFTSIVFDTNQFRNIRNSAIPFSIASELIPHIKDTAAIYDHLYKNLTIDKLCFFKTLNQVEYFNKKTIAFLHITQKYIQDCNTDKNQVFDLMDMVLDVKSVQHTALIIEDDEGAFKLSFRSKTKNLLPLVSQFDGGGHKHSAGAFIEKGSLTEVKKAIISYFSS